MNLAGQPASRPAYGLVSVPSNAGGVLMHPHDGRVDHLDGGIVSGSKRSHESAPYASPPPADEAIIAGGIWPEASGQVAQGCPGAQDPIGFASAMMVARNRCQLIYGGGVNLAARLESLAEGGIWLN